VPGGRGSAARSILEGRSRRSALRIRRAHLLRLGGRWREFSRARPQDQGSNVRLGSNPSPVAGHPGRHHFTARRRQGEEAGLQTSADLGPAATTACAPVRRGAGARPSLLTRVNGGGRGSRVDHCHRPPAREARARVTEQSWAGGTRSTGGADVSDEWASERADVVARSAGARHATSLSLADCRRRGHCRVMGSPRSARDPAAVVRAAWDHWLSKGAARGARACKVVVQRKGRGGQSVFGSGCCKGSAGQSLAGREARTAGCLLLTEASLRFGLADGRARGEPEAGDGPAARSKGDGQERGARRVANGKVV
jgi:hypothetical protein